MIGPMKLATSFIQDDNMKAMVNTVEIFITNAVELEAVFLGDYDGGDFCSGFIFGRSGSKMLMEIAGEYLAPELPDEHNPALKPPKEEPKGRGRGGKGNRDRVAKDFVAADKKKHVKEQPAAAAPPKAQPAPDKKGKGKGKDKKKVKNDMDVSKKSFLQ